MIHPASTITDWSTVVGKFILTGGTYEWSIVGGLRFVVRVAPNGGRRYVVRPDRLGEIDSDEPESYMLSRRVVVVCDTFQEARECLELNNKAHSLYRGLQKKQIENTKMLGIVFARCVPHRPPNPRLTRAQTTLELAG